MPTYSYRCTVCGHAFDVQQGFQDDALTVCPHCQGRLRKVFSPVGVVFKGSGFYRTDARGSGGKSSVPAARSGSDAASGSSGSGSSDSGSSGSASSDGGSTASGSTPSGGATAAGQAAAS